MSLLLTDLPVDGKRVIVRVDYNVPLDSKGEITDDKRIVASLPTIQYLLGRGASVILMSHLGRPKGAKTDALSLKPCQERLERLLGTPVKMAPDCVGDKTEEIARTLKPGEILLLENLRFHLGEEKPEEDPEFAKKLANLGDFFVNDAFGTAHRSHASNVYVAKEFQGKAAPGFLMEKEIKFLGNTLKNIIHPFYAIIGGAKISSKLGMIETLLNKVDRLFIGGAMAYTFLKANGEPVGKSLTQDSFIPDAKKLLKSGKIALPIDHVITEKLEAGAQFEVVDEIKEGWIACDIGPNTIESYTKQLQGGALILWNGPLGVFEIPPFDLGTKKIAEALSTLSATTIIGGGDSASAIEQLGLSDQFSHISTGGGASLEFVEKGTLPALFELN